MLQRDPLWQKVVFEIVLILVSVIAMFPFLWMAISSLKPLGEILKWPITILPQNVTLRNYVRVFTSIPLARYLLNSFVVAIAGSLLVVITSATAAYAISIIRIKSANLFIYMALMGLIIPVQIGFVPLFMMVHALNIDDSYVGLIFPFIASPFGVFLLAQFFKMIPVDLVDAARIDGMNEARIIQHIVIPLGNAGMTTLIIFQFMIIWREFFWPLLIINDDSLRPVTLGIASFFQADSATDWGLILAATTTALLPILLVFVIFQRRFIKGITWSGLKV